MGKIYLFFLFQFMLFSVKGQITGPSTATVGTPVSFSGPSGQASYTWSLAPTGLAMNSTLPRTTIASFASSPLYLSVLNDQGTWYALFLQSNNRLYRLNLGADPTIPTANAPVELLTVTGESTSGGFIYDSTSGNWHGFIIYTGVSNVSVIQRIDFGNSLANMPAAPVNINVQPAATSLNIMPCDLSIVKDNGEYFLFVGSRWGFPARISFGSNITNTTPTATLLPGTLGNNTSVGLYKQDGRWYGLAVTTQFQTLWRYEFGTSLGNTPTLHTVGTNIIGNTNNWNIRVVPGDCGDQVVAYVNSGNNMRRLNFNGDITSVPTLTAGLLSANFTGTIPAGLFPYVFNDKIYAMVSSYSDRAIYNIELSDLPASTEQIYNDPVLTHTFSTPGTYELSLITGVYGNGSSVSCHTITVQSTPSTGLPIISVDTVCINTPVNFSSGIRGNSFTWVFDSVDVASAITTTTTSRKILLNNTNLAGGATPLKYDSSNGRYYSFWGNWNANNQIYRLDFGTNPLSTPVVTTVSLSGMGFTGTNNGHMDVVRDDVTGNWHLFWGASNNQQLLRVDLGNSLANTPSGGTTMSFTGSNGLSTPFQITFKKYNGEWIMFSANNGGPNISRLDFGASLTNTNPTVTILPNTLSFTHPGYFSLYEHDGDWHLFFVTTAATNRPSYRYDFGPDLKNNTPSLTFTGGTGGIMKSIRLLPNTACGNQLFGYGVDESARLVKFDFSGDITTNTPAISSMGNFFGARPVELSTFVYGDTIYTYVTEFTPRNIVALPLLPLPAGTIQKYYDPAAVHTFTTPGVHTVTLMVDQGDPAGPATYCKQIIVELGIASGAPGPFTDSAVSVCRGQRQVRYAIPPVAGATGYVWTYTGAGATINGSDTAITIDFSSAATSGMLRVSAVGVGSCGTAPGLPRELSVTVNPLPALTITPAGTAAFCQGRSLNLTANGATAAMNYQWKRNGTDVGTNDSVYTATAAGDYSVVVTNVSTHCFDTTTVTTLTENPSPVAVLTPGGSIALCGGDTAYISTQPTGAGYSYQWIENGVATTNTDPVLPVYNSGTYSVVVTNSYNCPDTSAAVQATVHALPAAVITPSGTIQICRGDQVILNAATGAGFSYEWKQGASVVGNAASYAATTAGDYFVKVTDGNNCTDSSDPVTVIVYDVPDISITPGDTAFCNGGYVTLNAVSPATGLAYQWQMDGVDIPYASVDFYEVIVSGTYTVMVNVPGVSGCVDTSGPVSVTVHPLPVPVVSWDGTVLYTDTLYISYEWLLDAVPLSGASAYSYVPLMPGSYTVAVTDTNGCRYVSDVYNLYRLSSGLGNLLALADQVKVYPNPAGGIFRIDAPLPVTVSVHSLDGREMLQQDETKTVDISRLADGMYLVRVVVQETGALIKTEKLIKRTSN